MPDLHGSIAGSLAADEATLTHALRYDAYGQTIATGSAAGAPSPVGEKPWRYQGRLDVSPIAGAPLYDMSARFYAPSLGAFTQLDTVMGGAQNPLSMNRFLYAEANPATLIDPTGHCVRWQDDYCVGALSTPARKQLAHKPTLNRNRNTIPNDEWVPSRNRQRKTTPKFTLEQVTAMDPLEIAIYGRGALRDLIGGSLDPATNPGGFHVANAYLTDRNRELVASIGGALNPNDFISGSRLELRRDLAYAAGDDDAYGLLSATLASETGLGELEMVMGGTVGGSAAIGRNSGFLSRAERAMRGGGVGNVGLDERVSRLVGESSGGGGPSPAGAEVRGKPGPKPWPLGPHNRKIREFIDQMTDQGWTHQAGGSLTEEVIPTPFGSRRSRRPDITFSRGDETMRVQVGKTNASGQPVPREVDALNDLESVLGQRPWFVGYN